MECYSKRLYDQIKTYRAQGGSTDEYHNVSWTGSTVVCWCVMTQRDVSRAIWCKRGEVWSQTKFVQHSKQVGPFHPVECIFSIKGDNTLWNVINIDNIEKLANVKIGLPLMKPAWSFELIVGRKTFNLWATALARTLTCVQERDGSVGSTFSQVFTFFDNGGNTGLSDWLS